MIFAKIHTRTTLAAMLWSLAAAAQTPAELANDPAVKLALYAVRRNEPAAIELEVDPEAAEAHDVLTDPEALIEPASDAVRARDSDPYVFTVRYGGAGLRAGVRVGAAERVVLDEAAPPR